MQFRKPSLRLLRIYGQDSGPARESERQERSILLHEKARNRETAELGFARTSRMVWQGRRDPGAVDPPLPSADPRPPGRAGAVPGPRTVHSDPTCAERAAPCRARAFPDAPRRLRDLRSDFPQHPDAGGPAAGSEVLIRTGSYDPSPDRARRISAGRDAIPVPPAPTPAPNDGRCGGRSAHERPTTSRRGAFHPRTARRSLT